MGVSIGHFSNIKSESQEHSETISIEVPAHTQQKYVIIWQETRREGTVVYLENGEQRTANYSYRIGVELLSSTVTDLPCSDSAAAALPTSAPSPTTPPDPTATPNPTAVQPTDTPRPVPPTNTPVPANTSPGTTLTVGERWYTDGRQLVLDNYEFESTRLRLEIRFINNTAATSTFTITLADFAITDNLGRRSTAEYPLGCGTGGAFELTLVLDAGESDDCRVYFGNDDIDYANAQVNQLIFSVTASVFQNASWQIPIQH